MAGLTIRHIQNHNEANTTEIPYWGYAARVVPCTKDQGTCEYLAAVYGMHATSMTYTFILWGVILGILVVGVMVRGWRMGGPAESVRSSFDDLCDWVHRLKRRWLLKDAPMRWLFGRVSRLQVAVLGCLMGYLLVFSLVGIVYRTWITPVEDYPNLFNTRTGLGGWSDRLGALAYALTPFTILLSNRESVLTLLTGIPYQHFNFLHRWTGRIIFVQSFLHTLGWTLIEGRFYQPQPAVYAEFIGQMYMVFGVLAMFLMTLMLVLSTKTAIRWFGYEFFKITHWIIAVLYIGACWGHWDRLWCWMVPSLALIVIDQLLRGLRTCYIHFSASKGGSLGFTCAQADVQVLGEGDDVVIRLDFDYEHREPWKPGQHFYLCFPSLSIWQSHPFTPLSTPKFIKGVQHHTYLIRVRHGQTSLLVALAGQSTLPVILTGPYGNEHPRYETRNVLTVAGGTGVSFTLPVALMALSQVIIPRAAVEFVWVVRRAADLAWLTSELAELKVLLKTTPSLRIQIFVTREATDVLTADEKTTNVDDKAATFDISSKPSSSIASTTEGESSLWTCTDRYRVSYLGDHHPAMSEMVADFMERAEALGGNVEIVGSGPEAMGSDLRRAIAAVETPEPLDFYWDSRD